MVVFFCFLGNWAGTGPADRPGLDRPDRLGRPEPDWLDRPDRPKSGRLDLLERTGPDRSDIRDKGFPSRIKDHGSWIKDQRPRIND